MVYDSAAYQQYMMAQAQAQAAQQPAYGLYGNDPSATGGSGKSAQSGDVTVEKAREKRKRVVVDEKTADDLGAGTQDLGELTDEQRKLVENELVKQRTDDLDSMIENEAEGVHLTRIYDLLKILNTSLAQTNDVVQSLNRANLAGGGHTGWDETAEGMGPVPHMVMVEYSPEEVAMAKEYKRLLKKGYLPGMTPKEGMWDALKTNLEGAVGHGADAVIAQRAANFDSIHQKLRSDGDLQRLASQTGVAPEILDRVLGAVAGAGVSAAIMGATGNFPLGAMGYFATNTILNDDSKALFNGVSLKAATYDGVPVIAPTVSIPRELPNDIFANYQYICYDRVTGKVWPSDEVKVIPNVGNPFRWFVQDRLDGQYYHCYAIKAPRIYLGSE